MMTEHESASGPTFYASRRRGGGAVSRARAVSAAIAMLLAVAGPGTVGARTPAPCGPFRVDWNRGELSPTAEKLEGFVYNDSSCSVTDVRVHIVAMSADGHPIGETLGWVYGDIPAGGRGYFVVPLAHTRAVDYRINVVSFDEVQRAAQTKEQAP